MGLTRSFSSELQVITEWITEHWSFVSVSAVDFDECAGGISDCDLNADCVNTNGSYKCSCRPGFFGDGVTCQGEGKFIAFSITDVCQKAECRCPREAWARLSNKSGSRDWNERKEWPRGTGVNPLSLGWKTASLRSLRSLRSWRSLSRCSKQRHGRHFVLVADGRLRTSDKITGRGEGMGIVASTTSPPPLNFVSSPQSPICHQYKMAPVSSPRIDWDRQAKTRRAETRSE